MGIDYFLTYKSPKPLAILISEKLEKLLDDMERNLGFVLSDGKNLDWNDVLSGYGAITEWFGHNLCHNKPITNIKTVLNIYMVINRYEEELYDIVDAKERNNRFFELLNSHDYKPDILPDDKIKQYRVLAQKLKREKEGPFQLSWPLNLMYVRLLRLSKDVHVILMDGFSYKSTLHLENRVKTNQLAFIIL